MKKLFTLIAVTLLVASCGTATKTSSVKENNSEQTTEGQKTEKTVLTTSILPLASMVRNIGGETVEVKNMVGAGQSPHNFDFKSSDMMNLEKSEAVVMIGMEHIDGFLDKNLDTKKVLKLSEGIGLMEMGAHEHEHETHEDEHEHTDEHNHEAHEQDPHIWNSPKNAPILAKKIAIFLGELQPKNKEVFMKNATAFSQKIEGLMKDFEQNTERKEQQYFIVFHDAHNYLLRDLEIDADKKLVFRKSVLNDPNSQDMKELIDEIKLHNVKVAFVEPQFTNANFEKLASEYGIEMFTLDPLGADESAEGYLQNTENNIKSLEKVFK